jgi:predicted nucleotidyltransferase
MLTTTLGALDLLGETVGGGGYEQLLPDTTRIKVGGVECLCLDLERLILVKRAAGRPKDLEVVAELERIRQENS